MLSVVEALERGGPSAWVPLGNWAAAPHEVEAACGSGDDQNEADAATEVPLTRVQYVAVKSQYNGVEWHRYGSV